MAQSKNSFIKHVNVDLFKGVFSQKIKFNNRLNIIGGENGTGKTHLLKEIKRGGTPDQGNLTNIKFFLIDPKRNAEKIGIEELISRLNSDPNRKYKKIAEGMRQLDINDSGFVPGHYPSFVDLFIQKVDEEVNKGNKGKEDSTKNIEKEFNKILEKSFKNYSLEAQWISEKDTYNIQIIKNKKTKFPVHLVSCGEQDFLSLIFNIYINRDEFDTYLIDEPEVHLNWNLEKDLFKFLNWFCEKFQKQIIVTTHSMVIFDEKFQKNTIFLIWKNNKIIYIKEINSRQKRKLLSDYAPLSWLLNIKNKTFFVEDVKHKEILIRIIEKINKENLEQIDIVKMGCKSRVEDLYKIVKEKKEINNIYFLIDGDNQNSEFKDEKNFIQLSKYCVENYLFYTEIMKKILNKTKKEIEKYVADLVKKNLDKKDFLSKKIINITKDNNIIKLLDIFDMSKAYKKLEKKETKYIEKFFNQVNNKNIYKIFDKKLIDAIKK